MKTPEVSVIVPNYNHAPYLQQRIESILNQTYQYFELIILDDCSTDNSKEIIEQYKNHPKVSQVIYNTENSGSTFKQWNKGVKYAKGEFVWIAESDDVTENTLLEKTVNQMKSDKKVGLCFVNSYIIDGKNNILGLYDETFELYKKDFCIDGNELIKNYFSHCNIIPNASAVLFKRSCFENAMPCLTDYKINGDWFLWINILKNNNCTFISEPLNYFRRHKGAGSPKNVLNFKNIEEAIRINIYLRKNGFNVNHHDKLWLKSWIRQAKYDLIKLLRVNFIPIYKEAIKLYFPLPVACYLIYYTCKFKIKK